MADQRDGLFPIRYAVQGGSARIDLALEVAADGSAAVDVLTESSLPQGHPVRLGRFAGRLPADLLASLATWAGGEDTRAGMAGPVPLGTVARLLTVGGQDSVLLDPASVPAGLEEALAAAAAASLAEPVAAVEVGVAEAGQLRIHGLGTQPSALLLFALDVPGFWIRIWREDPSAPGGQAYLPYEAVEALVKAGKLAEGPLDLAPGASLSLPLPAPVQMQGEATNAEPHGGFMFWRRGKGLERRLLIGTW
jgi:hypothetical protein